MRVVFILAIFLSVSNAESISSFLTDGENKTSTSLESKKLECYDLGILRQMINQETVIRLALVKNVHALINDFNLIKQSLASSEATVTKLQRTNEALNLAVNSLQQENRKLQNNSRISESKIMELETKLQTVNDNLNIIQEDSDKKRQEIFNKTNSDLYDIKIVLRYLSVTLLDFKESTENENDLRDKKYEELKRFFNTSFENLKANYSQNEFYSTNNKALIQNLADSQAEIRRTCTDILNKTVAKHETQLKTSEYEQLKLSSAVALLEAAHRNLSKSNCDILNRTVAKHETQLKTSEYEQLKLSSAVALLEAAHRNLSKSNCDKSSYHAFTAGISSVNGGWTGDTLVFPVVIYSEGTGYNPSTGIFTAPTAGTYVFYVSIQSAEQKKIWVDIVLNGSSKVRALAWWYSSGSRVNIHQTGTNLVILHLQTGDSVWVNRGGGTGYYSDSYHIMTFSGFKLY